MFGYSNWFLISVYWIMMKIFFEICMFLVYCKIEVVFRCKLGGVFILI